MKINFIPLIAILTSLFMAFSCVPAKQFKQLQENHQKCMEKTEILEAENQELTVKTTELNARIKQLEEELQTLANDSVEQKKQYMALELENKNLQKRYDELQKSQEELIKGSAAETKRLLRQLQATQEDLQGREDKLLELQQSLEEKRKNLDQLQRELEKRDQRLVELESILQRKDSAVNALQEKVSNALLGFKNQGLSVQMKNGKVYVSLEEQLLFRSGSSQIDPKGESALQKLAKVLEKNPDIQIMIEGHTDDVPYIPDEAIKDNWDLSVKRATTVVRVLLNNSSIDPSRLTAAGRGEHVPLATGETPGARRKNRRTEIILTPDLNELYEIIGGN